MTIIHNKHHPMTGTCGRCGREDIPDDELFLLFWEGMPGPGWHGVCWDCNDGDGSLRFHDRTLAELRAHTLFDDWMTGKYEPLPVMPL